ncbi:hypothetical protein Axy19_059 [Achromobacter phage vB_AxyS_19-32_Axy19]|nr:hypothetical protein Axy19_059 [Achromobacter phage vB_AxyS_19-32_Axy19]
MTPEQAIAYMGLPWKIDGRGPDAFNCWYLLCHIQRTYFGKEFPQVDVTDGEECTRVHAEYLKSGAWEVVTVPQHGDGVVLKGGRDPHVGVYLDFDGGGVLHCQENDGVIFTPRPALRSMGYGRATYYRIHK